MLSIMYIKTFINSILFKVNSSGSNMKESKIKRAHTTAYTVIDAQGQSPVPVDSKRGVPQKPRLRLKKQVETLRVGSWTVGPVTGKGREVVDVMERRKVEILCVQETKWKGNSARKMGNGYKLLFSGSNTKANGVGIMMNKKMAYKVVEVERYSDRIMRVKLSIGKGIWNVISVYAPQAGRSWEEKETFVEELEEMLRTSVNQFLVIGGDSNPHLGEKNEDYTEEHGNHGYGSRNDERDLWLEMMQANHLVAINT